MPRSLVARRTVISHACGTVRRRVLEQLPKFDATPKAVSSPDPTTIPARAYDTVIVGGGAAGCVLARRLTEDPARSVLLVEAGPPDAGIGAIADAARWATLMGGEYDWGHEYAASEATGGRRIPIPRGRVLGGSSSINAMLWYRGHPADYDRWNLPGWDFAAALPYFRRSEDWQGGADPWRGAGGPMRIEQASDPHPIARAMLAGAADIGVPMIDDANAAGNEGACLANYNMHADERWSAARGYLHPVLDQSNLTVLTRSTTLRLVIEGGRCTGIVHLVDGQPRTTRALGEVILSAGAIGSPVLLLRSGIGAAAAMRGLGLDVAADLPGVGENLQDHPLVMGVNFRARRSVGAVRGNGGGAMMNWRSRPGLPGPDLHAFVVQGPHADARIAERYRLGPDCYAISPGLMRSESRGYFRLHGDAIEIQPNFLRERGDLEALMRGVETCMDLAATPAFADLVTEPASPARRLDWAELEAFVRETCSTFYHTCGTCRMGADDGAVVDPELRVRGIAGLRMVDASVMPDIPSCNTQAPVIMIAERAADLIKASPC